MDILTKGTRYFAKKEATAGVAETMVPANAFDVAADTAPMTLAIEEVARDQLSAGEANSQSLLGARDTAWSATAELKAGETVGAAPECDPFLEAGLGVKYTNAEDTVTDSDAADEVEVADAAAYKIGQAIHVKSAGGVTKHISAVKSKAGNVLTLLAAYSAPFTAGDKIAASKVYETKANKPSLTVMQQENGTKRSVASGCKVEQLELGVGVNQTPTIAVTVQGLGYVVSTGNAELASDFQNTIPSVIDNTIIRVNGTEYEAREFMLTVANGIANKDITNRGRVAKFITSRKVTFKFIVYNKDDSKVFEDIRSANQTLAAECIIMDAELANCNQSISLVVNKATVTNITYGDEDKLGTTEVECTAYVNFEQTPELVLSFS